MTRRTASVGLGVPVPFLAACLLLLVGSSVPVAASPASYTIDPGLSTLSIVVQRTGQVVSHPTTTLSGTIAADANGGQLTFSGGSSIVANANPNGPFLPPPPSGAVDNYGFSDSVVVSTDFSYDLDAAYRSFEFDLASGSVSNGDPSSALGIRLLGGFADLMAPVTYTYLTGVASGVADFAAANPGATALLGATPVGLSRSGSIETLTIPVQTGDFVVPFQASLFTLSGNLISLGANATALVQSIFGPYLTISFDGQIVATRTVAEPTPRILLGLGLLVLGVVGRGGLGRR